MGSAGNQRFARKTYQQDNHGSDPFCERSRAADAADYLERRRRELDGEVKMQPLGGYDSVSDQLRRNHVKATCMQQGRPYKVNKD